MGIIDRGEFVRHNDRTRSGLSNNHQDTIDLSFTTYSNYFYKILYTFHYKFLWKYITTTIFRIKLFRIWENNHRVPDIN